MPRRISLALGVLALVSCSSTQKGIDPKDLLERTATAQQQLSSANITLKLSLQGQATAELSNMQIDAKGSMQEGGKLLALSGTLSTKADGKDLILTGDVVLAKGSEQYVRITKVAIDTGLGASIPVETPALQGFLNRWWLLPGARPQLSSGSEADPSLLPQQINVLDIVHDRGSQQHDGHDIRTLDVRVNAKRLQEFLTEVQRQRGDERPAQMESLFTSGTAEGTVTIDEQTFLMQTIHWEISGGSQTKTVIELTQNTTDPVPPVTVPEGALPLVPGVSPLSLFLQGLSPTPSDPSQQ